MINGYAGARRFCVLPKIPVKTRRKRNKNFFIMYGFIKAVLFKYMMPVLTVLLIDPLIREK